MSPVATLVERSTRFLMLVAPARGITQPVRSQPKVIYNHLFSYWHDTDQAQSQWQNDERVGLSQDEANELEEAAEQLIQLIHAEGLRDV